MPTIPTGVRRRLLRPTAQGAGASDVVKSSTVTAALPVTPKTTTPNGKLWQGFRLMQRSRGAMAQPSSHASFPHAGPARRQLPPPKNP